MRGVTVVGEKRYQRVRRGYCRSQEKAAIQAVLDEDFYEELDAEPEVPMRTSPAADELPHLMADRSDESLETPTAVAEPTPAVFPTREPPRPPSAAADDAGRGGFGSTARRAWTRLRELFAQKPRP
jgi:hypothetical protein